MKTPVTGLVALLATLLFTSDATASVDLTASGVIVTGAHAGSTDLTLAAAGDQVQVDIVASNTSNDIAGLTLMAFFDRVESPGIHFHSPDAPLRFDGGLSSAVWFNETTGKRYNDPQGGLDNIRGSPGGPDGSYTSFRLPNVIGEAEIINGTVQFFSGASPADPASGSGQLDFGILDGGTGPGGSPGVGFVAAGASHARLFFTLTTNAENVLHFGACCSDGLVVASGDGILSQTTIAIGFVPEPTTALLTALGLAALSSTGRGRRREI